MKWIELSVESHPEAVDAIANVFQEHGTGGVAIVQPVTAYIESESTPTFQGLPIVRAYLPVNEAEPDIERGIEESLWHLQAFNLSPVGPLKRREIEEEDWANGWKEHFHPLEIGRVVIKPTWREWSPAPDQIVVELDPGMAFGTGLHPTTRLMIETLQERILPGIHVLDLGTGSGILSIAATLLGANVEALDISEIAVEVARDNMALNGLSDRVAVRVGSLETALPETYDLILANIIAGTLVELAHGFFRRLEPGAELLASGIIADRTDAVREAFIDAGLEIGQQRSEGDWWLIAARRPA